MAVSHISSGTGAGRAASGSINLPTGSGIVAGDLLLLTVVDQGLLTGVAGFTPLGIPFTRNNITLWFYWKIATGSDGGSAALTFSGTQTYVGFATLLKGSGFSAASFLNFATLAGTNNTTNIVAPNQGVPGAGQLAWSAGGAFNGTHGTNTVTGTGWTLSRTNNNAASSNVELSVAYGATPAVGAQFNFINSYTNLLAGSFIITDTASAGAAGAQPLMVCEA